MKMATIMMPDDDRAEEVAVTMQAVVVGGGLSVDNGHGGRLVTLWQQSRLPVATAHDSEGGGSSRWPMMVVVEVRSREDIISDIGGRGDDDRTGWSLKASCTTTEDKPPHHRPCYAKADA